MGCSSAAVWESPLANSVTWWPWRTSSSVRYETMRSVPPYSFGGTLSASGETCAIFMHRKMTKRLTAPLPDKVAPRCSSSGQTMLTPRKKAVEECPPSGALPWPMLYAWAADAVMAFHFLFIAFALLGSLLVIWKRWILWLHLPALAWGAWIEASGGLCPLTPLENHFRELAGQTTYGEGFITHYLAPLIYPAGLTRSTQFLILGILVAVNLLGHGWVLARARR